MPDGLYPLLAVNYAINLAFKGCQAVDNLYMEFLFIYIHFKKEIHYATTR